MVLTLRGLSRSPLFDGVREGGAAVGRYGVPAAERARVHRRRGARGGARGGAHAPGGGANAQQAIRRLLTGESASAGTLGARATARLSSARSLAAALGPSGTKHALALAKVLLHDDQVERALIGEGEELEDT